MYTLIPTGLFEPENFEQMQIFSPSWNVKPGFADKNELRSDTHQVAAKFGKKNHDANPIPGGVHVWGGWTCQFIIYSLNCSLSQESPWNRLSEPHHIGKSSLTNSHPPRTGTRKTWSHPTIPLGGAMHLSTWKGHHGQLNESECPKDPSSALSAQLR